MGTAYSCDPCKGKTEAKNYCDECEEYLCDECAAYHKKMKATKQHLLIAAEKTKDQQMKSKVKQEEKVNPGRPKASEILSDSITLVWDPPTKFEGNDCYKIYLKDMARDRNWRAYQGEYYTASANLSDLKSNTRYIFRVRVMREDGEEGQYSPVSEKIQTSVSLAARMLRTSTQVTNGDFSPVKYSMPLTEIIATRNERAKTRKFKIGTRPTKYVETKTIMLVGETGAGKSTFVDGVINYVLGVTFDDPFRYTIFHPEDEEKHAIGCWSLSQTEWVTCYTIYPENGSRLKYQLQIIDTPGLGDARGLKRDQEIVGQIRQLFTDAEPKGITCVDAVCFVIKAPDARLTAYQYYKFQSIMSCFGKDIEDNICSLITFADGDVPPVSAALKQSKLPFGEYFVFNNSALFANNVERFSLAPFFWNMCLSSFRSFFIHLGHMRTKSLQLTKDVLLVRHRLEAIVRKVKENLKVGLQKTEVLKRNRRVLAEQTFMMEAHKDYEKYNDARGKTLHYQQIVQNNETQLQEHKDDIEDMMLLVKHCNERLEEIALKPNPLSCTKHIDRMILDEQMTKKQII